MAEILCIARENDERNLTTPSLGDIVAIGEDGNNWGPQECLDSFVVVRVDMPLEEARQYQGPLYGPVEMVPLDDGEFVPHKPVLGYSRYRVELSGVDMDALRSIGWEVPTLDVEKIIERGV